MALLVGCHCFRLLPQCHTACNRIHKLLCTGQVSGSSSFFMHTHSFVLEYQLVHLDCRTSMQEGAMLSTSCMQTGTTGRVLSLPSVCCLLAFWFSGSPLPTTQVQAVDARSSLDNKVGMTVNTRHDRQLLRRYQWQPACSGHAIQPTVLNLRHVFKRFMSPKHNMVH